MTEMKRVQMGSRRLSKRFRRLRFSRRTSRMVCGRKACSAFTQALHGCMRRNAFTCAGIRMRRNACGACVNEPVQCLSTRVHPGKQNKPLLKEFVRLRGRVDQLRFYYVCLGGLVWVCWSAAAGMHLEDGLLRPECMQRLCVPSQEGTT